MANAFMTRSIAAREGLLRGSLLLLLIVLALVPRPRSAAAQAASTGVLAGVVLDQEDRQPLPNARVALYRMSPGDSVWTMVKEGLTDAKGAFRYTVPAGIYRLILYAQSYTVNVRDDVVIAPGATVDVSATLTPRPLEIKGIEVKGEQKHDTETSALTKRKRAETVTDVISAEQISKSTDANAAEALQRVTGLSLVGGRYVYVRGMGERYSSTQVNGSSLGTPEPNKRVVPLDLFPSGTLDEIVVQKTYSPDQEGEFAGGVIQLHTRDAVEGKRLAQSLSTGYSSPTLGGKRLTYSGGSLDFLGYDDGARDLPDAFLKVAGSSRLVPGGVFGGGLTPAQIQAAGRSFNKTWSPERTDSRPNYGYSGTYSQAVRVFGKPLSFVGSLSLSNNIANRDRDNNAYAGTSTRLTPLYLYKVEETTRNTLGGALANWNLRLANGHSIGLRTLYTRSSEDNVRVMQGPNFNFGADLVRISSLNFIERGLASGVVSGEHTVAPLGGLRMDWRAGYSEAMRDEPDRRESVYESNGVGGVYLSHRVQAPLTRVFGDMNEYDRSAAADLTKSFMLPGSRAFRLKTGGFLRHRNRISSFRRLAFVMGRAAADSLDTTLPPEELLVDKNIKPRWFSLIEETRENDQYRAKQHILAGYGMAELEVMPGVTLQGGVRNERSDQAVEAKSPYVTNAKETDARLIDNDFLPAANGTWRLTERMNARLGYSVTVSRPELREMSPFDMYDYETGYSEVGNPQIQSTNIQNYDARWEFYPGPRELISVSGFRKVLFQPIESIVLGSSGGYILMPRNGRDGRVRGLELETRIGIARIWDAAARALSMGEHSGGLERWALSMNYARVESSVRVQTRLDGNGAPFFREGPLQGQSTYSLNAGLYYGSNAMDASLLLSSFGKRLAQVGAGATQSSLPDIYEHPPLSLDMAVSRNLFGPARVKVSAENLLNRATEFRQLDKVTRRYRSGRTVSVAMSLRG